jgi:hypothetical protein
MNPRARRLAYASFGAVVAFTAIVALLSPLLLLGLAYQEAFVPVADYKRHLYFNKPEILYYDEAAEIKLIVNSHAQSAGQISLSFQNLEGKVEQATVLVGSYLSAKLTAPASLLEIAPSDDRLRKIDPNRDTEFAWYVRPVEVGLIPIRLDLLSQDSQAKDSAVRAVQVFQENWTAEAKGLGKAKYVLSEYKWLFGAVGAIAAFFGIDRWRRRGDDNEADEN